MSAMTRLRCLLTRHKWVGCRCAVCDARRDEDHAWSGCTCAVCGLERDHVWSGCKCVNCGQVRDSDHTWAGCTCSVCGRNRDHRWNGCRCSVCGGSRDLDHAWDRSTCGVCGAKWTMHHTTLVIDRSACGLFVETELRDWARGFLRTSNGAREHLAGSLGIQSASVREIIDRLMVPVLKAHHEELVKRTTEPAHEGSPAIDAEAWLATGAECRVAPEPSVAALFVLYYVLVQVEDKVASLMFTALADEINRRSPTFEGELWRGYVPQDIVLKILDEPESHDYVASLMKGAVQTR